MTETLISLLSIVVGILGSYSLVFFCKKFSMGLTGNTIAGVFGSIFFIKLLSRLGFDPVSIMKSGDINVLLLLINLLISLISGAVGLCLIKLIYKKMNPK